MVENDRGKVDFIIFVHVFYPDVWEEMRRELEDRINQDFALVITRPPSLPPVLPPKTPFLVFYDQFDVENRGRDILPFIRALRRPHLPQTDIALKMHTKRSPHRSDGADWRRFLSGSLLATDRQGKLLGHSLLIHENRVGLIAANAHLMTLEGRTTINDRVIIDVLRMLYGQETDLNLALKRFAAGSMFWFRPSALACLLPDEVDSLFSPERGQLDGTAAHAFERLFTAMIERQGYLPVAMENALPILSFPPSSLSAGELARLIENTLINENPFTLPLPDFWRKNPRLLKLAHMIYARLPKGVVRTLRMAMRR